MKKPSSSLIAIVLATVMFLAVLPGIKAQPPLNTVPAPCMYLVGPSGTDGQTFYTNTMGIGSTFNVTAWINTTYDEGGWAGALIFNPSQLQVVSVAFTANDSSQSAWFYDQGIYDPLTGTLPFTDWVIPYLTPPTFDNTAGTIGEPGGFGEAALSPSVLAPSVDTLFNVTFAVNLLPSSGSSLTSVVYWDPAITCIGTTNGIPDPNASFGSFTYTLATAPSSTSVVCQPSFTPNGTSVTCTATVTGTSGYTPTGTVTWTSSSLTGSFSPPTSSPSSPGSFSTTYTDTGPGTPTITATYSGDTYNSESSGYTTLVVCPNETTSASIDSQGNAYADQSAVTGVTVSISGSSAPQGTSVTVASTNYGNNLPVTGFLQIDGATYYDVEVSPTSLGSGATANVSITPVSNPNSVMVYVLNSQSYSPSSTGYNPATLTLSGIFPVSDLTGTPIMILPNVHHVMAQGIAADKTVIGEGYPGNVTVTVANGGAYTETFNLTACANTTIIASENVTLTPAKIETIMLTWNTTGVAYGNYTVSAYALPVPGQTNTTNTNCTGGWVIVSIIGDITGPNGWPDGQVNMRDVAIVVRAFGSDGPNYLYAGSHASSNWNPNADLNNDGTVNMRDIALVARNFGQHT